MNNEQRKVLDVLWSQALAASVKDGEQFTRYHFAELVLEQHGPVLPLDMILYCPNCGRQHIDAPDERTPGWVNKPHRSHLCHDPECQCIWRPADFCTNGVESLLTEGQNDTWPSHNDEVTAHPAQAVRAGAISLGCWCEACDVAASPNGIRTRMCVCPECGDKRCPRASHHNQQCAELRFPAQRQLDGDIAKIVADNLNSLYVETAPTPCKTCNGEGGWEREHSSTRGSWVSCPDCINMPLSEADEIRNNCPRTYNRCGYDATAKHCIADGCPGHLQSQKVVAP